MRLVILLSVTTQFVIPVKTGIHCDTCYFTIFWIPAFAGMTQGIQHETLKGKPD
jgi:hypothetical protein